MLETTSLGVFVATEQVTTKLPVRSAPFKQRTGEFVVRWVTTSEYPLLYVFVFFFQRGDRTVMVKSHRAKDKFATVVYTLTRKR
jgi:hypothetical protein